MVPLVPSKWFLHCGVDICMRPRKWIEIVSHSTKGNYKFILYFWDIPIEDMTIFYFWWFKMNKNFIANRIDDGFVSNMKGFPVIYHTTIHVPSVIHLNIVFFICKKLMRESLKQVLKNIIKLTIIAGCARDNSAVIFISEKLFLIRIVSSLCLVSTNQKHSTIPLKDK